MTRKAKAEPKYRIGGTKYSVALVNREWQVFDPDDKWVATCRDQRAAELMASLLNQAKREWEKSIPDAPWRGGW